MIVAVCYWKFYRNGEAYSAQILKRRPDVSIAEAREAMRRIPDAEIYLEIPEGVSLKEMEATAEKSYSELYIKRPSVRSYETDEPREWICDIFCK